MKRCGYIMVNALIAQVIIIILLKIDVIDAFAVENHKMMDKMNVIVQLVNVIALNLIMDKTVNFYQKKEKEI
jgi:hypothetical protein